MRSYRPAIRSNIDLTCASVARARSLSAVTFPNGLAQALQVIHQRVELLRWKTLVGRHRRGRVSQRPGNRIPRQAAAYLRKLRPRAVVSGLAELVAGTATRLVC